MARNVLIIMWIAGILFCLSGCRVSEDAVPDDVLAEYRGQPITKEIVQENMERFSFFSSDGQCPAEEEMLDEILENMILLYEAERRGLAATEEEIQTMLDMTVRAYEIPEGREQLEAYFAAFDVTYDGYMELLKKETLPRTIARQKLRHTIGQEYCEENGLEYTNVNPPKEMTQAVDAYIEKLVQAEKKNVTYYNAMSPNIR